MKKFLIFCYFILAVFILQAQQGNTEKIREYIILAQTADKEGDLMDALKEYKNALNLAPKYPELYKAIGSVYERLGGTVNLTEAIIHYQHYLELAPNAEDSRTIQDKVYALQYLQRKSQVQDAILDDLSGIWVAVDNLQIANRDKTTGNFTYFSDFIFEISEIQKTGKYRVTILKEGSRYYSETIIDKTVNIVPQKDASFNFTFANAQVHTPNQGGYTAARGGMRILQNFGIIPNWLGDAANVAVDVAQSNDLPSNTQTAYTFALRYIDGKLEGLVNVVQKFANPNQQRTLENGLYEITFVKKNENFINEINQLLTNKPDTLYTKRQGSEKYLDKYGNKLSKKDIVNKLKNFDPQLGNCFQKAQNLKATGITMTIAGSLLVTCGTPLSLTSGEDGNAVVAGLVMCGVGSGIFAAGIPMWTIGSKRTVKIIDAYNNQISYQPKCNRTAELGFGATSTGGFGLALKF